MTDPGAEASRAAIAAERLRSIRFVGLFRFVGISIAFALNRRLPAPAGQVGAGALLCARRRRRAHAPAGDGVEQPAAGPRGR
jgi:hypothetical protein